MMRSDCVSFIVRADEHRRWPLGLTLSISIHDPAARTNCIQVSTWNEVFWWLGNISQVWQGRLRLNVVYSQNLHERPTVEALAEEFQKVRLVRRAYRNRNRTSQGGLTGYSTARPASPVVPVACRTGSPDRNSTQLVLVSTETFPRHP